MCKNKLADLLLHFAPNYTLTVDIAQFVKKLFLRIF